MHVVRRFSGYKMIPPGLHLLTWNIDAANAGANTVQRGIWCNIQARKSLVLNHHPASEDIEATLADANTGEMQPQELDLDQLRSLDAHLAPYPFSRYQTWKALTDFVKWPDVQHVTGTNGKVDSLSEPPGDREVATSAPETVDEKYDTLNFTSFDLKRSWREGAVGEEVTRFHKDKSWLWCDVVTKRFSGGKPGRGSVNPVIRTDTR